MPLLKKHIELSLKRSGKEFREVHEWMDGRGVSLKDIIARHNILKIPGFVTIVEEKFGKDGVREYLQHIKDDYKTHLVLMIWKRIIQLLVKRNSNYCSYID